jgi:hypothetical protein
MLVSQRERGSDRYFTNLLAELVLFRLEAENERFDWGWIDGRRDPTLTNEQVLELAPEAWRRWVEEGETSLARCRRRIIRRQILAPREQLSMSEPEHSVLKEVEAYYREKPHAFEGLASLVAQRVLGPSCLRGWVTRRSGDGGVDFVSRLDLGSEFSTVRVVILGQAKCTSTVAGKDLARLVARLQRGWIGIFVTTGSYSTACQQELIEDKYPLVLIGGARLARELRLLTSAEGISLGSLFEREDAWYQSHLRPDQPERVTDDDLLGYDLILPGRSGPVTA